MSLNKRLIAGGKPPEVGSFDIVLYTGDGSTNRTISGLTFTPDFVWIKERSSTSSHYWHNSTTGAEKYMSSDYAGTEGSDSNTISEFKYGGFVIGSDSAHNQNNVTYVAWCWKCNGGVTSTNTDGSINSTVQANTTFGLSIFTYTGTGSTSATVGHGLGAAPAMIICKGTDWASSWGVYHENISGGGTIYLEDTGTPGAEQIANVGSSTFQTNHIGTNNNGKNFLCYAFIEKSGLSSFGTYTGISSGNVTVTTGFQPDWVMVKCVSHSSTHWEIHDSKRVFSSNGAYRLRANENSVDGQFNDTPIKYTSTGFYLDSSVSANSYGDYDASGRTYIYAAFKIG
tara:strand:+ start:447 stop:1469 length:1023 start_codon:yes stop_codon:yes gene_type:complete